MFPRVDSACGIDVHRSKLTATIIDASGSYETKNYSTQLPDLIRLRDWIVENNCSRVLMEATGVYWVPVYTILEPAVPTFVANPYFIKYVPSSKTDTKDAVWIAEICLDGHFKASYIPDERVRDYRDLCRSYKNLVKERTRYRNRIHTILSRAGIRITPVISDLFGKSGLIILDGLVKRKTFDEIFAQLSHPSIVKKREKIEAAICGELTENDIFGIQSAHRMLQEIEKEIDIHLSRMVDLFENDSEQIKILLSVPGIQLQSASMMLAEIGDVTRFPSAKQLVRYAGLDPRVSESAGKTRMGSISKQGNKHLRTYLVECASALSRSKDNMFRQFYERIKRKKGHKQAVVAVARKLLTIIYHLLTNKEMYEDPLMTKPKQIKIPKLKTRQPIDLTNASQMLRSVMARIAVKTKTIDVYSHT